MKIVTVGMLRPPKVPTLPDFDIRRGEVAGEEGRLGGVEDQAA